MASSPLQKRARKSSSNDSDGESSQAIRNNNRYSVLSDGEDLPNIDQTQTEKVDQTTSDINREPKPLPIFTPGVKSIREFSAMIEQNYRQ